MSKRNRNYQPRRSRSQWRTVIEEFARSGLSTKQFCAQHELRYGSFMKWRAHFSDATPASSEVDFIELSADAIGVNTPPPRSERCCIELQVGHTVTVRVYSA